MNKKLRKRRIFFISTIIILSLSLISFKVFDDGDDFEIAKSFDIFHNAVREIRLFYVDDTDISKLIDESTEEFLKKLDPYTVYYPESKMEDFTFMTTGAYGGIGAMISEREGTLLITELYKGSIADKSSLKVGDEIVEINNFKISKENISEVRELLKGEPGSEVILKIKRYGESDILKKTIKREKIELGNISYSGIVEENLAFIKLDQFKQNAATDFKKALDKLNDSVAIEGLIIDLRSNPGGLLHEAVSIVSLFVKKGSDIVSTKGRVKDWNQIYKAKKAPAYPDLPIVVLMNSGSASASEIVAGAIQDLDRGLIVGQRSFGKGLVQKTRKMNYNTAIKFTIAKYYIPSGRCIQAIDYSNRNPDGSVGHISDSLISEFKTVNGRKVYDGGGISPDIKVEFDSISEFTRILIKEYIIFDFATKFFYENKFIDSPSDFLVTENIYNQFIKFAENKDIKYKTKSKNIALKLLESAKEEKISNDVISKITDIQSELEIDISEALLLYKEQIIPFIATSIVNRYYFNEGMIQTFMSYDNALKEAVSVLKDKSKYNLHLSSDND